MTRASLALFGLLLTPAPGWGGEEPRGHFATGIGANTCAFWLSSPDLEREGVAWVHGLWTGLNVENPKYSAVGNATGTESRIVEVRKLCSAHPSMALVEAALKVFDRMAGR